MVSSLVQATEAAQLDGDTPCDEFCVRDLLDHLNLVMARVATIGEGGNWADITPDAVAQSDGHHATFQQGAHDIMNAWADSSKLGNSFQVPWGESPGAPALMMYTAELATHGWDLAQATGQSMEIPDAALGGALQAAKMVPAEGRSEMPMFGNVVDPGENASAMHQIAGWFGRQVV